jgi:hypothetical protein
MDGRCASWYCESFNGKLQDEFLNGEIFFSLRVVQILTERWRRVTLRAEPCFFVLDAGLTASTMASGGGKKMQIPPVGRDDKFLVGGWKWGCL